MVADDFSNCCSKVAALSYHNTTANTCQSCLGKTELLMFVTLINRAGRFLGILVIPRYGNKTVRVSLALPDLFFKRRALSLSV